MIDIKWEIINKKNKTEQTKKCNKEYLTKKSGMENILK